MAALVCIQCENCKNTCPASQLSLEMFAYWVSSNDEKKCYNIFWCVGPEIRLYMKTIITTRDKQLGKRLLSVDDAFSLLWNVDQLCRNELKYGSKKTKRAILEEIREIINEDGLLDLYI